MRTIKIFSIGSHTFIDRMSGVDYVRILQPMKYLKDYEYKGVKFELTNYDQRTDPSFDWIDVFATHDIVYFNYSTNDIAYAVMGTMAQKYKRKLVCDVDDSIWTIKHDNVAYETFNKDSWGRKVITAVCGDVDYVTCTNTYLRNVIAEYTKKSHNFIKVLPNQIDLDVYKYRYTAKDSYPIQITWFGSSSHFVDMADQYFQNALDRIMKEYPNVIFKTIGLFLPHMRQKWGSRYLIDFGSSDFIEWVEKRYPLFMKETDIVVGVLRNDSYNKAKSDIKFLEYSSAQKPGVYSDVRPYRETILHGKTGYLAANEEQWYAYLKLLIDDVEERKKIGMNAFNYVKDNRTIQGNIDEYAKFFISVLDN